MKKAVGLVIAAGAAVLVLAGCTTGETQPATSVTATSAILKGIGHCEEGDAGEWWFQYRPGTSGAWTSTPDHPYGAADCPAQNVEISETVTGLTPGTQYQFQVCATDPSAWTGSACADSDTAQTNEEPNYDSFKTKELTLKSDMTELPLSLDRGIPIKQTRSGALTNDQTVVYSTKLDNAPANVRARIATSVATTYCAPTDIQGVANPGSPCIQRYNNGTPPNYPIDLEVHIYKASGPSAPSDGVHFLATTHQQGSPDGVPCTVNRHHCQVKLTVDKTTTNNLIINPNPGADLYLNVEIIAWKDSGAWQSGDLLELEGDCYDPNKAPGNEHSYNNCTPVVGNEPHPANLNKLADSFGHSNLLWLGPSYGTSPAPKTVATSNTRIDDDRVVVDKTKVAGEPPFTVVHSEQVDNLNPGDVLEAQASSVDLEGHGFDHSADSWWVLAPLSDPPEDGRALPADGSSRYMSGRNGINCLDPNNPDLNGNHNGRCSVGQNGSVTVPGNANSTMYLNYVVRAMDGNTTWLHPWAEVLDGNFEFKCNPQSTVPPDPTPCTF